MTYTEGHMTLTGDHAILLIHYHCFSMTSLLLSQHAPQALGAPGTPQVLGTPQAPQAPGIPQALGVGVPGGCKYSKLRRVEATS